MKHYDVIVIGGGVLGCFAARSLMRYNLRAAVLEQREDVCTGISRANTAIVYSGYDSKPNTMKSLLCVKANETFTDLCRDLGVKFSRCGSLMVCFGTRGAKVLQEKYEQGLENGVPGLQLLSGDEVLALEPNLNPAVYAGLLAPTTGTINPWELGIAAYENARQNGCDFFFNNKATCITRQETGFVIETGNDIFFAKGIINCAGLFADEIKEMLSAPSVRIIPERADYYILDNKLQGHIRHVIFHEPEEKGKGLTLVPTVDGNILVGPSEQPGGDKESFSTTPQGLAFLDKLCQEVVPKLQMEYVIRNFGSLRPNPYYVEKNEAGDYILLPKSVSSFIVSEDENLPKFISLIGIKTPGLTCSNELGQYVAGKMAAMLNMTTVNPNFDPIRTPSPHLASLSLEERCKLVEQNPAYGTIVCRCQGISEGEILNAIHRGATTVDGVKRRTGTGMGRCQGSFCTHRILELLAQELQRPIESITKDGRNSCVLRGGSHG